MEPPFQMTSYTQKRAGEEQEQHVVPEEKKVKVDTWFDEGIVNQSADLSYSESEIYQFETQDEKRYKTEMEFAALGIPIMTVTGPSSGTVLPKRGVFRYYEYDHENLPTRMIDNVETVHDGLVTSAVEQYEVLPDYQVWYRYALNALFPNTRVEPRVLETTYGAWAKICEWYNQGCIQRIRYY